MGFECLRLCCACVDAGYKRWPKCARVICRSHVSALLSYQSHPMGSEGHIVWRTVLHHIHTAPTIYTHTHIGRCFNSIRNHSKRAGRIQRAEMTQRRDAKWRTLNPKMVKIDHHVKYLYSEKLLIHFSIALLDLNIKLINLFWSGLKKSWILDMRLKILSVNLKVLKTSTTMSKSCSILKICQC